MQHESWLVSLVYLVHEVCVVEQDYQMKQMNQINLSRPSRSTIRRACRSYANGFHLLLNLEREKWIIPCQDTDLVDFIQMIR